ncbi:hypothetical protein CC78DRAFT_256349 [Lojkania enalia]|uniref:RZ-type domain-containing protein n=1 Tax=Lojkania enalia TaxID=147567 RepID=A0A9P4K8B5_9PLEO|nr:hypothetical protein CC78DRAFT_256349 [Didymosphaeria enalia]
MLVEQVEPDGQSDHNRAYGWFADMREGFMRKDRGFYEEWLCRDGVMRLMPVAGRGHRRRSAAGTPPCSFQNTIRAEEKLRWGAASWNFREFAIGECGMPMELARCPKCGARIGGHHHEAVQGVTRAENMEN